MAKIVDLINAKLPFIREEKQYAPLPGRIVSCLMPGCGKPFLMRPYIGEPDQVCPECFKTYRDCARIICLHCKVTICRVKPKVLDNGFYIRPRMVLHSDGCNVCKPGILVTSIVEINQYEKATKPRKIIIPIGRYK